MAADPCSVAERLERWRAQGADRVDPVAFSRLAALARLGIHKTHLDVYRNNVVGNDFWEKAGWTRRDDTYRFSMIRGAGSNA